MNRPIWQFGVGFLVITLLMSTGLVLASPSRFIQASVRGDFFQSETSSELALSNKLYLLQPNVVLASSLEALDWVESFSIGRELPNQIFINYSAKRPVACSQAQLYYSSSRFDRSVANEILCESTIAVSGTLEPPMIAALEGLSIEIRNSIERIEFQPNQAIVLMRTGQTAIVYPNDFSGLQTITQLSRGGTVLDLRQNYE
jgi:hypothetical protein